MGERASQLSPTAGKVGDGIECRVPEARPANRGRKYDASTPRKQTRSAALMARPNTGEVTQWPWKDGRTITFGARLYAYGRRHRLVFGTNT